MSSNRNLAIVVVLLILAPMILAACGATSEPERTIETVIVEQTRIVTEEGEETAVGKTVIVETVVVEQTKIVTEVKEVVVTPAPEPVDRVGGWLDTVIFTEEPDPDSAVTRLEAGDIDVYTGLISEPDIAQRIFDSGVLAYETSYGGGNELTFMPSTNPEFNDGRLNPFYSDKIREAMNWLIDRNYICQEIMGGLAVPRFVPIHLASKDSAALADKIAAIGLKYAYDPDRAVAVIDEEMVALGAEKVDGKWTYKGEPVVLIGLIRQEDIRLEIGDYVSTVLEEIGFTVTRDYKTGAEAGPCWLRGDPDEGCAHFYTGLWGAQVISRDESSNFSFFYTPDGLPFPPWQAYTPVPEFYELATRLTNSDFATMEERTELMAGALGYALEDSQRVWLTDAVSPSPHAADISLASDLSGSIVGSHLWAQTMRRQGEVGGSVTVVAGGTFDAPWNPVGPPTGKAYGMPARGTLDRAVVPDPFTGLALPMRLERAEVYVQEGLPVDVTLDWVTLQFVPEILVPDDAWADWDAENQVFITAAERFTETETAATKIVMVYQEDLFDKVTWHDGSPLTIGDIVMTMILSFDRSKELSPYYDEATVPTFDLVMSAFKGWRIVSEDPLVIEYYTDAYALDAENSVTGPRAAYPDGAWHTLVPGLRAEASGQLAFSADKAAALEVEEISFIAGPSLPILKDQLDAAQAEGLIPYAPTLGQYVTPGEAATRYANLQEFYRRYGHFWVGTGPYFLQQAWPVEGTILLRHYPAYPDPATRWDRFATAPVPELMVEGPENVEIGQEAVYDIFVTFEDEPYAVDDIDMVKVLVFDATRELAYAGDGQPVEDGHWRAVLGADVTGALEAGANQFAAVVVSKRVVLPITERLQFVTQ